jgi:HSP20 family protein
MPAWGVPSIDHVDDLPEGKMAVVLLKEAHDVRIERILPSVGAAVTRASGEVGHGEHLAARNGEIPDVLSAANDPAVARSGSFGGIPACSRGRKEGASMSLIRWEPFRALRRRDDVFDELFRDMFRRPAFEPVELLEPAVDVAESDGEVIVKMEVPGVEKDQLQLTVSDDHLTVRGETRKESEEKRKNYYSQEIRYGAFQRSIPLPVEVDAAKAHAELKNGMLKIALPKSKQPKAQEIKVAVA